jgi:hypothetical protein
MCVHPHRQPGVGGGSRQPLDSQDGGLGVLAARGVFSVRARCSPTCELFSSWYGVWSPDGLQESRQICVVDVQVSINCLGLTLKRQLLERPWGRASYSWMSSPTVVRFTVNDILTVATCVGSGGSSCGSLGGVLFTLLSLNVKARSIFAQVSLCIPYLLSLRKILHILYVCRKENPHFRWP